MGYLVQRIEGHDVNVNVNLSVLLDLVQGFLDGGDYPFLRAEHSLSDALGFAKPLT